MLSNKIMLVKLSIGYFPIKRGDNSLAREIAKNKGADERSIGANKLLISPEYSQYYTIQGELRNYFYQNTLPWENRGNYVLAVKLFDKFNNKYQEYKDKFFQAAKDFENNYRAGIIQQDAKNRLNGSFKASDFPPLEIAMNKFSCDIRYSPLLNSDDIRLNISKEEEEKIKFQVKQEEAEKLAESNRFLLREKLYHPLKHFMEELKKDKPHGKALNSSLSYFNSLVDYLENYNLQDDQLVIDLKNDIEKLKDKNDTETLQENDSKKKQAINETKNILTKIESYL